MFKLLAIFVIVMIFAHSSAQKDKRDLHNPDYDRKIKRDSGYMMVLIAIILFAGLRIEYNDTFNYWSRFAYRTGTFADYWADANESGLLKNPAFNFYATFMKQFTIDKTAFIFPPAFFSEYCLLRFLKKHSIEFDFSVFLFQLLFL